MSSQTSSVFKPRLEASTVNFGASQCRSHVYSADSTSDTNNQYIDVNYFDGAGNEVLGYIWFNVASAGVDPAPAGKTLIVEVPYAEDADGATRAAAAIVALDALSGLLFFYSVDSSDATKIVIDNAYPGLVTTESGSGAENIVVAELVAGFGGFLGETKEGIEVSVETSAFDITTNQSGALIIDQVIQGTTVNLSAAFLDLSDENKQLLIGKGVGDIIESGGAKFVGIGSSKLFQNGSDIGGRLILHPIRLPVGDRSADFMMWSSLAKLQSLNFDGTDTQALGVEFSAYLDNSKNSKVSLAVFGEWINNALLA